MMIDVDDVDDDDHSLATEVWLFMELALPWIRAGDCHRLSGGFAGRLVCTVG